MHFQHLAQRVQLHDFAHRVGAHDRADVALFFHHAQRLQVGQDLAHHVALEREARHEFVFGQALARVQPAEDDVFFQDGDRGLRGVRGQYLRGVGGEGVHGFAAYFFGTVSRVTPARRKSKSTPWSAWVTVCRNSLR